MQVGAHGWMAVEGKPIEYRGLDNPGKQLGLEAVRKALTVECRATLPGLIAS